MPVDTSLLRTDAGRRRVAIWPPLPLAVILGVLLLGLQLIVVLSFSYERIWWDGAHQIYRAILAQDVYIPQGRYIHLLTQALPVSLMSFASLESVLLSYSVSLALPFLLAVALATILRDLRGLLLAATLIYCLSTVTFFWAISEIRLSIGLAVALIILFRLESARRWAILLLFAVAPLFYFAHPVSLAVYGWLGLYYLLFVDRSGQAPLPALNADSRRWYAIFVLFCLWVIAAAALRYSVLNARELGIVQSGSPAGSGLNFWLILVGSTWLQLIVIIVSLFYMMARRAFWITAFSACSSIGWLLVVYIIAPASPAGYLEHLTQPSVFFALAPACYLLPRPRKGAWHDLSGPDRPFVAKLALAVLVGFICTIDFGQDIGRMRGAVSEIAAKAARQGIDRVLVLPEVARRTYGSNYKYLPVFSLLYTSAELGRSTVILPEGPPLPAWVYTDPYNGAPGALRFFTLPPRIEWRRLPAGPSVD